MIIDAKNLLSYDKDNVFAKIIRGELPCDQVYEDDDVLAFRDINPEAPIHILVIPKAQYISFEDFSLHASNVAEFFAVVRRIAQDQGLTSGGYRLVMNHGPNAGQQVPHFHVHILGGKILTPKLL